MRKVFAAVASTILAATMLLVPATAANAASPSQLAGQTIAVNGTVGGASLACGGCTVGF